MFIAGVVGVWLAVGLAGYWGFLRAPGDRAAETVLFTVLLPVILIGFAVTTLYLHALYGDPRDL